MAMFLICILIFFSGHKGRSNILLKEQATILLIINYYWAKRHVTPLGSGHYENRPQRGRTFIEFLPPGTKKINKTFLPPGAERINKTFVPPGTKKINKTFFAARGIMGIIHRA
jgi:hypothetical protein